MLTKGNLLQLPFKINTPLFYICGINEFIEVLRGSSCGLWPNILIFQFVCSVLHLFASRASVLLLRLTHHVRQDTNFRACQQLWSCESVCLKPAGLSLFLESTRE